MAKLEYEALVKIEDNVNPLVPPGELWKAGDIVDIHPKGWVWSQPELEHFLIVNMGSLEEAEAEALLREVTIDYEETGEDGNVTEHRKFIARRQHKVDVTTLLNELPVGVRHDVLDREKEAQPFRQLAIKPSDIRDITLRGEVI